MRVTAQWIATWTLLLYLRIVSNAVQQSSNSDKIFENRTKGVERALKHWGRGVSTASKISAGLKQSGKKKELLHETRMFRHRPTV